MPTVFQNDDLVAVLLQSVGEKQDTCTKETTDLSLGERSRWKYVPKQTFNLHIHQVVCVQQTRNSSFTKRDAE